MDKWDKIESELDQAIRPMNDLLGQVQVTIALLAGLGLVRSWVTELRDDDQWEQFRKRLKAAWDALAAAPDAGSITHFGLMDGVGFAITAADRIDGKES